MFHLVTQKLTITFNLSFKVMPSNEGKYTLITSFVAVGAAGITSVLDLLVCYF